MFVLKNCYETESTLTLAKSLWRSFTKIAETPLEASYSTGVLVVLLFNNTCLVVGLPLESKNETLTKWYLSC